MAHDFWKQHGDDKEYDVLTGWEKCKKTGAWPWFYRGIFRF